jgi:hypothetical protein
MHVFTSHNRSPNSEEKKVKLYLHLANELCVLTNAMDITKIPVGDSVPDSEKRSQTKRIDVDVRVLLAVEQVGSVLL